MGLVTVHGLLGRSAEQLAEIEFLVDTGSFYSAIPQELRRKLDLAAGIATRVQLADRRVVDAEVTLAHLRLLDRDGVVPVEIMDVPQPLLGVSALEALGLKVDPVDGKVEPRFPFTGAVSLSTFRPDVRA